MKNKIGFTNDDYKENDFEIIKEVEEITPRKSLVSVKFEKTKNTLSYYNDKFDLRRGDIVFVEGKFEGYRGRIIDVNYNFKIKLSDYKKVVAVADTNIKGELFFAESHFISFDKDVIPYSRIRTWYISPENPDDEIVCSSGEGNSFLLDEELNKLKIDYAIKQRGLDYYVGNNVVYISLNGNKGKAIVMGSTAYDVEFVFENGEISNLICDCFCNYTCKHEVAVILQLKELLNTIMEKYEEEYNNSRCFSAISTNELFRNVACGDKKVKLNLL